MMQVMLKGFDSLLLAAITIGIWELFGRDFVTWEGFGTPFRRKNRKPNH